MGDEKQLIEDLRGHLEKASETIKLLTIRSVDLTLEVGTNKKTVKFPNTEFLDVIVTASRQITENL